MDDGALYKTGQQLSGTVYRVVRHLATGGMGSVYDVEDTTVGKRYVLKTLHPQLISREDLARRMEAEARTLAKLQHPNIVDVVTAGVTADTMKMPFYVMERLNGQNLRVLLEKRGVIELSHAFRIAIDVLDALEHAHENNVIHRDVKPENIFLHRQINGTTITKLLDFGIMRLLDRKRSHTQGKFIGTLRYASPEQIMGGELGPATDIYSLGLVLYEMIAGRGPFDDVGDAYAVGAAHAQKDAPPMSTFTQVPRHVEALVMSSLAKNPAERPRDSFTFASELRRMLREQEAAPRVETAVNVLSQVPATRAPDMALDGTVPAEEASDARIEASAQSPLAVTTGTEEGMAMPSPRLTPPPARGIVITPAPLPDSGPGAAQLDRLAATHTSVPFGQTMRLASNGTEIDLPSPADAVDPPVASIHEALDRREPLVVPPVHPPPSAAPPQEIVFANPSFPGPSRTGPIAGEASTRPPERSLLAPLAGAIALAVVLVGGTVIVVKGRIARERPVEAPVAASPAPSPAPSSVPASSSVRVETPPPTSAPPSATAPAPVATPTATVVARPTAPPKPVAAAPATPVPKPAAKPPTPAPARPATPATARAPGYDD